jgi:hypothetical protein
MFVGLFRPSNGLSEKRSKSKTPHRASLARYLSLVTQGGQRMLNAGVAVSTAILGGPEPAQPGRREIRWLLNPGCST